MPAITNAKYNAIIMNAPGEFGTCGLKVVMPDGLILALHEQHGGYSGLFNSLGEEIYSIAPDGDIWECTESGFVRICSFDDVEATGELAPWLIEDTDGGIIFNPAYRDA